MLSRRQGGGRGPDPHSLKPILSVSHIAVRHLLSVNIHDSSLTFLEGINLPMEVEWERIMERVGW